MAVGAPLRGVAVGAGYFSRFHYDAWRRMEGAGIVALCDRDRAKAQAIAAEFGIAKVYDDPAAMLDAERADFIDIITPPDTHLELVRLAARRGVHILCQKALALTYSEAVQLVEEAEAANVRLMVHDNFRFQPWHREIRRLLDDGAVGALTAIACQTRLGDGWGPDAYLSRQPYFRTMPQLLVFETGVHFLDVFRYLGGEICQVYARLRRLNPVIAGEDRALLLCDFESGATALWDADRYHQSLNPDPRYTFGAFLVEGERGALRLDETGQLIIHPLGQPPREHAYSHGNAGFAGDSVFQTFRHFVDRLGDGGPFETGGRAYLRTLAVQEAVYRSAASGLPVEV